MTNLYHLLCFAVVPLAVIVGAMVLFAWRARVQP